MTTSSAPRPERLLTPLLLVALLVAGVYGFIDLRRHQAEIERDGAAAAATAARCERLLTLMRFEQLGKDGLGMAALLGQIREFAPVYVAPTTTAPERDAILARLQSVVRAMQAIDRDDAWSALQRAFSATTPAAANDETVRWILYGMVEVDADRAKPLLVELVRGLQHPCTPNTRLFAADRLIDMDQALAGETLHGILEYESASGINKMRMPAALTDRFPNATLTIEPFPGFYLFVQRYFRTEHADRESVLLMILGRQEHDLVTVQECVRLLGEMRSRQAVGALQRLFDRPPGLQENSIFRRHCLDALVAILGEESCAFLQEKLRQEQDQLVQAKLVDLIKRHCPSDADKK